ncbi:unnamed protein product [Protopolystoma xenopodis]|uniref:Phosphagen kinase C-terminal domain-containing protein n=1 Tax=Protopolystoma xenopodis TaxID=117903 RepID=A0A3S5B5Q4_9PLAT|nr:unnamed protein product [Protopolystoma xenopodis]
MSNKRRLGLTELQAVEEMSKGVLTLLDLEKKLAGLCNPKCKYFPYFVFTTPIV